MGRRQEVVGAAQGGVMTDFTFEELLTAGKAGDTRLDVRITARELAAISYLLTLAERAGLVPLAQASMGQVGLGDRWSIAAQSGLTRVAEVDQAQAALDAEDA